MFGPVQGQDKKKDPQAAFEPKSKPGVGQKFLEKFVGDWDVVKSFYPKSGKPNESKGVCRQTMIHEGRFLLSEFTFGEGDSKTTGTGTIGYEPETGLFTSVWVDSRQTKMSLRQSQDKFNEKEIVLFGKSLKDMGTKGRVSRTQSQLEDDGRKIVHRQFTSNDDGTERIIMQLVLTKKAKSEQ